MPLKSKYFFDKKQSKIFIFIISKSLMLGVLEGHQLSRRERKVFSCYYFIFMTEKYAISFIIIIQLLTRTVSDVFRVVPFSVFVLIPFMEIALPFFLKV